MAAATLPPPRRRLAANSPPPRRHLAGTSPPPHPCRHHLAATSPPPRRHLDALSPEPRRHLAAPSPSPRRRLAATSSPPRRHLAATLPSPCRHLAATSDARIVNADFAIESYCPPKSSGAPGTLGTGEAGSVPARHANEPESWSESMPVNAASLRSGARIWKIDPIGMGRWHGLERLGGWPRRHAHWRRVNPEAGQLGGVNSRRSAWERQLGGVNSGCGTRFAHPGHRQANRVLQPWRTPRLRNAFGPPHLISPPSCRQRPQMGRSQRSVPVAPMFVAIGSWRHKKGVQAQISTKIGPTVRKVVIEGGQLGLRHRMSMTVAGTSKSSVVQHELAPPIVTVFWPL